jgi:hypothetical protein
MNEFSREQLSAAVKAGCYATTDGALHMDIPRILIALGIEPTPEAVDYHADLLARTAEQMLGPDAEVEVQ